MPLPTLDLAPEKTSLSAAAGEAAIRANVAGGLSRSRLDQLGAPVRVGVQWIATIAEYAYLGAFFRSTIGNGADPFLIDLPIGYAMPAPCEARFLPGGLMLGGVSGQSHAVSANLEVKAPARNAVADAALVAAKAAPIGGLPVMALTPSAASYGVQHGDSLISVQPGLGPSAIRLDWPNTTSRVSVSWNTGPADFDYLCAFYWTAIKEGALPFLIETLMDHPDPRLLKAKMVPGSFQTGPIKGLTYSIRCDLEVAPIASPDYDAEVMVVWDLFGPDWTDLFADLEHLVNVTMPTWD